MVCKDCKHRNHKNDGNTGFCPKIKAFVPRKDERAAKCQHFSKKGD